MLITLINKVLDTVIDYAFFFISKKSQKAHNKTHIRKAHF